MTEYHCTCTIGGKQYAFDTMGCVIRSHADYAFTNFLVDDCGLTISDVETAQNWQLTRIVIND